MTDAIEGRWWLDFTNRPATNPAGNEFVLASGRVMTAETGASAGTYKVEPEWLTIVLLMPVIAGGAQCRMEAQLLLIDSQNPPDKLPGFIRAIDGDGHLMFNGPCCLVRCFTDA